MNPVVVVHGGAGSRVSPDREERVRQGVARAAAAGHRVLTEGGSAVDAVESAVAALEDDPEFNAGESAPRRVRPRPSCGGRGSGAPWGAAACVSYHLVTAVL